MLSVLLMQTLKTSEASTWITFTIDYTVSLYPRVFSSSLIFPCVLSSVSFLCKSFPLMYAFVAPLFLLRSSLLICFLFPAYILDAFHVVGPLLRPLSTFSPFFISQCQSFSSLFPLYSPHSPFIYFSLRPLSFFVTFSISSIHFLLS